MMQTQQFNASQHSIARPHTVSLMLSLGENIYPASGGGPLSSLQLASGGELGGRLVCSFFSLPLCVGPPVFPSACLRWRVGGPAFFPSTCLSAFL